MELTTVKRVCVLWRTAKLLCARTSSVLWDTWASASVRGLRSLAFCCVRLCTCTSASFELVLASLCGLRSSVVHMSVDPWCFCGSVILPSSIVSGIFVSHPWFYCWWCSLAFPLFLVGFSASSLTWLLALVTLSTIIWQPCWTPPTSLLSLFWRFLPLLSPVLHLFLCLQLSQLFCIRSMISHRPFLRL